MRPSFMKETLGFPFFLSFFVGIFKKVIGGSMDMDPLKLNDIDIWTW